MRGSVTEHICAPPERVWPVISDVTGIGRFSPETFEARWLDGATGPAVGARFQGHVRRNGWRWAVYWTTCVVTACEPGREFAFTVHVPGTRATNTWSYRLAGTATGTEVTESYRLSDVAWVRLVWRFVGDGRHRTNLEGMQTTLRRVKELVESAPSAPAGPGAPVGPGDPAGT